MYLALADVFGKSESFRRDKKLSSGPLDLNGIVYVKTVLATGGVERTNFGDVVVGKDPRNRQFEQRVAEVFMIGVGECACVQFRVLREVRWIGVYQCALG